MKSERFLELMSKTDDDLIERAENSENTGWEKESSMRRNVVGLQAGKRNRRRLRGLAAAAGLVLMVGIGFNLPAVRDLFDFNQPSVIDPDNAEGEGDIWLPAKLEDIIWKTDNQGTDVGGPEGFIQWNGWAMDFDLYDVLQRTGESRYIAVLVSKENGVDLDSFAYKGTTYRENRSRDDELRALQEKLWIFPKEGEWLKYGEQLYTTGTPDGEKWAKNFYEERVAYYGEAFLAEYIVDGVVQNEKIEAALQDIEAELAELLKTLHELLSAYHESYGESVRKQFSEEGVCAVTVNGRVFLFVTADELAGLKVSDKGEYMLSLAKRSLFEGGGSENSSDIDEPALEPEPLPEPEPEPLPEG